MGRQQSDPKAMAGNMASFAKELKSATPLIMQSARALDIWTASAQKAANAMARLRNGGNAPSAGQTQQQQYGGGGNGRGGMEGMGSNIMGLLTGGAVLHTAKTAMIASWAKQKWGGYLSRGSVPGLDDLADWMGGRDQREKMEDLNQQGVERNIRWTSGLHNANFGYLTGMNQLKYNMLGAGATSQERLDMLGSQAGGLRSIYAHQQSQYGFLREAELQSIRQAEREYLDKQRGLHMAGNAGDLLGAGNQVAGGHLVDMNIANSKLEYDSKVEQIRLEYAKKTADVLAQQQQTLQALLANEQQQLEIAKSMAQKQQEGAVSFGGLTPTEQRAATQALQTLNAGGTISGDEQAILGKAGPVGQRALRDAYFRNAGPEYENFMQAGQQGGYVTSKEIDQFRQGQQATNLLQGGLGALGVNLPTVEVNLTVNEQLLAQAIAKEVGEVMKELRVKVEQNADNIMRLESATGGKDKARDISAWNGMGRK